MSQFFAISVKVMRILGVWYDEKTNTIQAILFLTSHSLLIATLLTLEFLFVFVTTDYVERIKTIGIVTFHMICVIKVANAIRVEKHMQNALKLLMAFEKKIEFDGRYRKMANRFCFLLLILFVIVSQSSLIVSYINALTKTSTECAFNVSKIVRVMPYNHYHLLDVDETLNFVIEAVLQGYSIMFMTFCFICK